MYLIDLTNGNQLDAVAALNPQRQYGADVISRTLYTIQNPNGLLELQRRITDSLTDMLHSLCKNNSLESRQIHEMMVVGNTIMLHLFLGVSCAAIASAPYIPVFSRTQRVTADLLGIPIRPYGRIITLPAVSGYVGADIIADVLACGMYKEESLSLLLDIGTNGEIVLGNAKCLVCCSTAAGPAFEGAGITCGMGGVAGAIDRVDLNKERVYTTICNETPKGVCGSGLVSAAAQFLKHGIIETSGRMKNKTEAEGFVKPDLQTRIFERDGKTAFWLDEKHDVFITQKDIRELQLAKGAIYAGVKVLCHKLEISFADIDRVYLAGGFGNYLDTSDAIAIKLIPEELVGKITLIGNGAGSGAKSALLSQNAFEAAEAIAARMEYLELSASKEFSEIFMDSMDFRQPQ